MRASTTLTHTVERIPTALRALCAAGLLASAALSHAAPAAPAAADASQAAIQARYAKERANCLNGNTVQDRDTCLREAGAARDQASKGALDTDNSALQRNALERCKAQPAADQAACRERVNGQGSTSGSVQSGGVMRSLTQVEPAAKPDAKATEPEPGK